MALWTHPLQPITFHIAYDDRAYLAIRDHGGSAVLTLEINPEQTIGDFKRKWEDENRFKATYIDLRRFNSILESDTKIERIIFGNFRVNVEIALRAFQIFAVTLTGKTITINEVDASSTISEIKEKIAAKIRIPSKGLRITYQSNALEDFRPLHHYQIVEGSHLRMVLLLLGGGSVPFYMPDPAPNGLRLFDKDQIEGGSSIQNGLNVKTTCLNQSCTNLNQEIWVPRGFSYEDSFNLRREANTNKCPSCSGDLETATNIGFYDCSFSYNGVYRDGEQEIKASGSYTTPSKKLATPPDEVQQKDWLELTMTVTPRETWFSCLVGCCCCC